MGNLIGLRLVWLEIISLRLQKMKIQKSEFRAGGYCEAAKPAGGGTGACETWSMKP